MAKKRVAKKEAAEPSVDLLSMLDAQADSDTVSQPASKPQDSFHSMTGANKKVASAPANSTRISDPFDLTAEQKAALNLEQNLVISASAGTGKTHTLTALYLGLLEGRLAPGKALLDKKEWLAGWQAGTLTGMLPNEIIAVTYTEKAAAELLERTRAALENELAASDLPEALKAHLVRCRKELLGAPVSTIHSFCARLLRDAGAESTVPAAFTVLEAEECARLFEESLAAAAAEMLESDEFPYLQKMAHQAGLFTQRLGLIPTGKKLIETLRSRGLTGRELKPRNTTTLDQIRHWLENFYDAVAAFPDKGKSKPKPELREICGARLLPETLDQARILALTLMPLVKFAWYENSDIEKRFGQILEACHVPYIEELVAFVDRAETKYTEAKRKAGGIDFDDMMLASRKLLKRESAAAERRGYKFVLIDEFQDTNPLQEEILKKVAFPDGDEKGVARLGVVGDIKQSIYGFRGADVTLMQKAIEAFGSKSLRTNFRSRKGVIAWFNGVFKSIWGGAGGAGGNFNYDEHHQFTEIELKAPRHAWGEPACEVITWDNEEKVKADRHRIEQAFAIARRIRTLVAPAEASELKRPKIWDKGEAALRSEVRYGDIAILARSLKNLRVPLQIALSSLRIPFRILKGLSFFTRPEIIDVTNLWAVACDSTDSFAVAGLLRSPFVGMSDAGLWRVSDERDESAFRTALAAKVLEASNDPKTIARLSPDDAIALRRAAKILTHLSRWRGRRTAVEILDWALTETGFLSVQAFQPRGEFAVAAVRRAIEMARKYETRGNRHLSDFVRGLREQADAEWENSGGSEGQDFSADLPAEEDTIQIGTIHSAKGLEFPIVIFADAGAAPQNNSDWANYSLGLGLGLRLGSEFDGLPAAPDSIHSDNAARAKENDDAERLRLLYVALTRAQEYVIVVGEAGSGQTNWRKLIDAYHATVGQAEFVAVDAKHPDLKAATVGAISGLLEFKNGIAAVREHEEYPLTQAELDLSKPASPSKAGLRPARDIRVSVSRLALWLWCPRKAAFSAWETEAPPRPAQALAVDEPTQDGEDAASGVNERDDEVESSVDVRALGTAVHAALETIFGAEEILPLNQAEISAATSKAAIERFARELQRESATDDPAVKTTLDRAMALARSEWGRGILALPAEKRAVETPFRWRIEASPGPAHVTLIGQFDLMAETGVKRWQIVDYKLASLEGKDAGSEAVTRYAWQAGLYALAAAEILGVPQKNIEATLAFLRDAACEPRNVEDLGHRRIAEETLRDVISAYASVADVTEPLELRAQMWTPADQAPKARTRRICESQHCPYVSQCYRGARL